MDDINDFEIKNESTENVVRYTLYCKGIARARLESWRGVLYVHQMMIGPVTVEEFQVFAHGLTEFLLVVEEVEHAYKNKTPTPTREKRRRKRRS